jgi:hypothetical protein
MLAPVGGACRGNFDTAVTPNAPRAPTAAKRLAPSITSEGCLYALKAPRDRRFHLDR